MVVTDTMKKYYDKKLRCPKCYKKVVETYLNPPEDVPGIEYKDTRNIVICSDPECAWRGVVDELR